MTGEEAQRKAEKYEEKLRKLRRVGDSFIDANDMSESIFRILNFVTGGTGLCKKSCIIKDKTLDRVTSVSTYYEPQGYLTVSGTYSNKYTEITSRSFDNKFRAALKDITDWSNQTLTSFKSNNNITEAKREYLGKCYLIGGRRYVKVCGISEDGWFIHLGAEKEADEEFLKVYMFENFVGLDEITLEDKEFAKEISESEFTKAYQLVSSELAINSQVGKI